MYSTVFMPISVDLDCSFVQCTKEGDKGAMPPPRLVIVIPNKDHRRKRLLLPCVYPPSKLSGHSIITIRLLFPGLQVCQCV